MVKTLISDPIWGAPKIFPWVLLLLVVRQCSKLSSYTISRPDKMAKKLVLGPILACFGPSLVPKKIVVGFTCTRCYTLLYAVIQCEGKLMNQTSENGKKSNLRSDSGPNFGPQNLFLWILPVLDVRNYASYHCMQFQGKQMSQTLENGKKPSFDSILANLNQILAAKICFQKLGFFSH